MRGGRRALDAKPEGRKIDLYLSCVSHPHTTLLVVHLPSVALPYLVEVSYCNRHVVGLSRSVRGPKVSKQRDETRGGQRKREGPTEQEDRQAACLAFVRKVHTIQLWLLLKISTVASIRQDSTAVRTHGVQSESPEFLTPNWSAVQCFSCISRTHRCMGPLFILEE